MSERRARGQEGVWWEQGPRSEDSCEAAPGLARLSPFSPLPTLGRGRREWGPRCPCPVAGGPGCREGPVPGQREVWEGAAHLLPAPGARTRVRWGPGVADHPECTSGKGGAWRSRGLSLLQSRRRQQRMRLATRWRPRSRPQMARLRARVRDGCREGAGEGAGWVQGGCRRGCGVGGGQAPTATPGKEVTPSVLPAWAGT